MAEKEKELTLTQQIAGVLKANAEDKPEGYIGSEKAEALALLADLKPPIVLRIPWCVWDYELDEFGTPVLELEYSAWGTSNRPEIEEQDSEEEKQKKENWKPRPKRVDRIDALAILAWIPMKREDPEITLGQVTDLLNHETIREITRMVFKFWGIDLAPIEEALDKLVESEEEGEPDKATKAEEAEETANFTK